MQKSFVVDRERKDLDREKSDAITDDHMSGREREGDAYSGTGWSEEVNRIIGNGEDCDADVGRQSCAGYGKPGLWVERCNNFFLSANT